jgi:hypothetical protein
MRYQTMKKSTVLLLVAAGCASLLDACADSRQMTAEQGRGPEECSSLEGLPDCDNGHIVGVGTAGLSVHHADARDTQPQ